MFKGQLKGFASGFIAATIITSAVFASPVVNNIKAVFDDYKIFVDGTEKSIPKDMKPFTYNGRIYASIRNISEILGKEINYDSKSRSINIASRSSSAYNTPAATAAPVSVFNPNQLKGPQKGETIAVLKTSKGDIKIKFFPKSAPKAVENFLKLAKSGYYNNVIFHRVIKDFMIQGGDPTGDGTGGESAYGEYFEDEIDKSLHHFRGALSMANAGPNTNGSQFFIVQNSKCAGIPEIDEMLSTLDRETSDTYKKNGGTPWLDGRHTIFGQVYEGLNIVDQIAGVETNINNDKPVEDIKILGIDISEYK